MSEARVLHEWKVGEYRWTVRDEFDGDDPYIWCDDNEVESGVMAHEILRLARRVARLEAALAPFAKVGECRFPFEDDSITYLWHRSPDGPAISVGDVKRARAALAEEAGE